MSTNGTKHVVVIGGGFAGVACAKRLAGKDGVQVTLVDRNGYHQFQPLLYQVATAELTPRDIQFDLDTIFEGAANVEVRKAEVVAADPEVGSVTLDDDTSIAGDVIVLAAGSQPNFFNTPGAAEYAYPLYSLEDAERIRARVLQLYRDTSENTNLLDQGSLTFVVIGGGATGVESAGALGELAHDVMPHVYENPALAHGRIVLVDLGHAVLAPFSDEAHEYAARQLKRRGVEIRLGVSAKEIGSDHVTLSDGTTIDTHLTVWGGGLKAARIGAHSGLTQGRGGRIDVEPDLTVEGHPNVYALGDFANVPSGDEPVLPQLGSVAQQSGDWAAKNILADLQGESRQPFRYRDKGIMAMIGRKAAVAEVGAHRHEMNGRLAFAAWLGVHAQLLANAGAEMNAFLAWADDFYLRPHHRSAELLDPAKVDAPRIDWNDG
ncbi:MAG TPA: NAD(P)/FAD-dependent oxidoreductase [Gaiellaceae bacterium]|nr:NAD(P)/FAD-dependent oxidoreductase [Gaiellaceae bacterium]